MNWEGALVGDALALVMIMARLSGMLISAPLLALRHMPMMWKALVVGLFSLVIMPTLPPTSLPGFTSAGPTGTPEVGPPSLAFLLMLHVVVELAIGCLLGSLFSMAFAVALSAGTLWDTMLGFSNATVLDPGHESHPLLATFYQAVMSLVVLGLDGHLAILLLVIRSFQWMPLGDLARWGALSKLAFSIAGLFFPLLFSLCLPLLMALLGVEIIVAFLSKLMPQVNIMIAGASLKIALGWFMVMLALPATMNAMDNMFWDLLRHFGGA